MTMAPRTNILISYTLTISLLHVASAITGCRYGEFRMLKDTCAYRCDSGSDDVEDKYFNLSALSFDYIKSECPNVEMAAINGICDGIEDLVYGNDTCRCPYCKCQSPGSEMKEYFINVPFKQWMNCTCQQHPSRGINQDIYTCTTLIDAIFESVKEWYYYSCPPNQCVVTKSNSNEPIIKEAGDSWWADVEDSDTDCQTFCHCSSEGEAICKTGWENIMTDEWLKYAFMDECDGDTSAVKYFINHKIKINVECNLIIEQCWDETGNIDVSRLSASYQVPYCPSNSCPKCECPVGFIEGDEWCNIYGNPNFYGGDSCKSTYNCNGNGNGNLYSSKEGYLQCGSSKWLSCETQANEERDRRVKHM